MRVARLIVAMLGVGLVGSPLAALYCNDSSAASMACCRGDMTKCHEPGKSDDCCRTTPRAGSDQMLPGAKADALAKATALHAALPVQPLAHEATSLLATVPLHRPAAPSEASPPRNPVLRT